MSGTIDDMYLMKQCPDSVMLWLLKLSELSYINIIDRQLNIDQSLLICLTKSLYLLLLTMHL